jgi:hypothetical protein
LRSMQMQIAKLCTSKKQMNPTALALTQWLVI